MELSARIDQVMASLEALKVQAADAPAEASSQFSSILETALDSGNTTDQVAVAEPIKVQAEAAPQIPGWVDPDYDYDPANPRKPNMRELMEALSGRPVEALYSDANSNWQDTSRLASEFLYGVVGSNDDTRDWSAIMGSSDIVRAAPSTCERHLKILGQHQLLFRCNCNPASQFNISIRQYSIC